MLENVLINNTSEVNNLITCGSSNSYELSTISHCTTQQWAQLFLSKKSIACATQYITVAWRQDAEHRATVGYLQGTEPRTNLATA